MAARLRLARVRLPCRPSPFLVRVAPSPIRSAPTHGAPIHSTLSRCAKSALFRPSRSPWLDKEHPDRLGEQLRRVCPVLRAMLSSVASEHGTIGVMWGECYAWH